MSIEKVQANQRLITDLLEDQSLLMVEYHRFLNVYTENKDSLNTAQKFDAKTALKQYREQINSLADRILKLQQEITTIISGEVK